MSGAHHHAPSLAVIAAVLLVGAFMLTAYSFYNGHNEACQARNKNLDVLSDVLRLSQQRTAEETLTDAEAARAARYFTSAYARIDQARC